MLKLLIAVAILAISGVGIGAFALQSNPTPPRPDCPGKIICPLTGEEVCKDQCPLIDPNREDCPGLIECPIDGQLVCEDRCPLNKQDEQEDLAADSSQTPPDTALPSCCADN